MHVEQLVSLPGFGGEIEHPVGGTAGHGRLLRQMERGSLFEGKLFVQGLEGDDPHFPVKAFYKALNRFATARE